MSTHVNELTVDTLQHAQLRAATVDHPVTLVVKYAHVVVVVDPRGRVVLRPEEQHTPDWLYRTAGS